MVTVHISDEYLTKLTAIRNQLDYTAHPDRVQTVKDIIQKQDRTLAAGLFKQAVLCQFECYQITLVLCIVFIAVFHLFLCPSVLESNGLVEYEMFWRALRVDIKVADALEL